MQYILMGAIDIFWGLSTFIFKKYPAMNRYYSKIERKYVIKNRNHLIVIDGVVWLSTGIFFLVAGILLEIQKKQYVGIIIILEILNISICVLIRNKFLQKK